METLFVYGTLREAHVQMCLIGRVIEGQIDELRGYRRDWTLLPPYPVAIPCEPDEHIRGHILQITEDELALMDTYEGRKYIRARLILESGTEAWVYIGNPVVFSR
jgi:gamma-glutamylcyclotransferase (GGCT)/AIG2-like uncharacterized protein YtfP